MVAETSKVSGLLALRTPISRTTYLGIAVTSFVFVLLAWALISYAKLVPPYFLPTPIEVMTAFWHMLRVQNLLGDIGISFFRVMTGFVISALLAVPLGILVGSFKSFEALVEPINDLVRYMPVPAFIPLIILWCGLGNSNQIATIFIGTFFQLVLLVADSVSNVPNEYIEIARTLYGEDRKIILLKVIFPAAFPSIYDNLRVSAGWAWSYLVLAEIVAANSGVGHSIVQAQRFLQTGNVIAGIIVIGVLGLIIDYAFKLGYRFAFPWSDKVNS